MISSAGAVNANLVPCLSVLTYPFLFMHSLEYLTLFSWLNLFYSFFMLYLSNHLSCNVFFFCFAFLNHHFHRFSYFISKRKITQHENFVIYLRALFFSVVAYPSITRAPFALTLPGLPLNVRGPYAKMRRRGYFEIRF